jgi:hypothetical protein
VVVLLKFWNFSVECSRGVKWLMKWWLFLSLCLVIKSQLYCWDRLFVHILLEMLWMEYCGWNWTALISMYSNCGSLVYAHRSFIEMSENNLASWTVMVTGCWLYGKGREAVSIFYEMLGKDLLQIRAFSFQFYQLVVVLD